MSASTTPPTRLSASALWRLQREYFASVGVEAWRRNTCPSYVTTNPFIAEAYARLVHAHLTDAGPGGGPVVVLELGAGAGRLGHHFLESFHALPPVGAPVRYVLSDVARANVDFWRAHPKLQAWAARGLLDLVQLGADGDGGSAGEARLEVSGRTLREASAGGRVVAIANYVFDSIEQDVFVVQHGLLWEGHVTLSGAGEGEGALADLALRPHFVQRPGPAYPDPLWTRIVEDHRVLPDGAFLFPVGALRTLGWLHELSRGELLVLSADKGAVRLADLAGGAFPDLVKHGSVSFTVNYHALGEWVRARGGVALEPPACSAIAVIAYAFGAAKDGPALRGTYQREVADFGPDDWYLVKRANEGRMDELDLDALLALLRLSRWDVNVLLSGYAKLLGAAGGATRDQRHALREGLLRLWARHLPLGEEHDVAFHVGCVLAALGWYEDAAGLFQSSLETHDRPEALENLERCLALRRAELEGHAS